MKMFFATLMLSAITVASAQTCPPQPKLEDHPYTEYWFEGKIGQEPARLYINRGGSVVVGVFYYLATWKSVMLGGKWLDNGSVLMHDEIEGCENENCSGEGILSGQFGSSSFSGNWRPAQQSQSQRFEMSRVNSPKCSWTGPWRTFNDPRWSVTFSFPASWHLEASGESITLTCPDPSYMAYEDWNITLSKGTRTNHKDLDFIQCGGKWWHSQDCACGDSHQCKPGDVQQINGMTVISDYGGITRLYCRGGGYVGTGDLSEVVVLTGGEWVQLRGSGPPSGSLKSIIDTIQPRP